MLYGENVFTFQISVLFDGSIAFFEQMPSKYLQLITKVYIRTGHVAGNYKLPFSIPAALAKDDPKNYEVEKRLALHRAIAISTAQDRQAWPTV